MTELRGLSCRWRKLTMIEARQSPVDGMWRAWGEFTASQVGLLSEEDKRQGVPDLPVWVCVATAKKRWDAINAALAITKRMNGQRRAA